ncbi:MAG TPA: hypothetical protein VMQ83_12175 [Gammaproteobacteria bacterium]|nr:hypothetical protein [Gammaproteobacteria bacterium]
MDRRPASAHDESRPWRRRQRDIAYVAWASFLMACAGTAVFFAMVDPQVLSGTTTPGWEISREAGYAIGFFGFWLLTAATGVFLIWLVRTENGPRAGNASRRADEPHAGRRRRDPLRRRSRRHAGQDQEERP